MEQIGRYLEFENFKNCAFLRMEEQKVCCLFLTLGQFALTHSAIS